MGCYMFTGKNNAKSWDGRIYNPDTGRGAKLQALFKGFEMEVIADYFTSGGTDFLLIADMRNKIDAHAFGRAMMACGMLTEDPIITELLTLDEYAQMLKRASEFTYPVPWAESKVGVDFVP